MWSAGADFQETRHAMEIYYYVMCKPKVEYMHTLYYVFGGDLENVLRRERSLSTATSISSSAFTRGEYIIPIAAGAWWLKCN